MNSVRIADSLLKIGAVKLDFKEGFQWVSGITSPIYCDNRLLISAVEERKKIAKSFAEKIKQEYPKCNLIAGTATAGIPHAAWVADELNLPMIYVRSKPKEHGKKSQIEGSFSAGDQVVLIEDLISTGKSSIAAAQALDSEGLNCLSVMSIFSYQLSKADRAFEDAKIKSHSLSGIDSLISCTKKSNQMTDSEVSKLEDFFKSIDR